MASRKEIEPIVTSVPTNVIVWELFNDDIAVLRYKDYVQARNMCNSLNDMDILNELWEAYDKENNELWYFLIKNKDYSYSEVREMIMHRQGIYTEEQLDTQFRLSRHASIYEVADRILTNQDVTCRFEKSDTAFPAFNDGQNIVFNLNKIDSYNNSKELDDDDFLLEVTGLNYHELGHLLWTPRQNSAIMKTVIEEGLLIAFNVLEDNRIESFITAKYPSVTPFLLSLSYESFKKQVNNNYVFVILGGRPYLPKDIIDLMFEMFEQTVGNEIALEVVGIINQYRTLVLPDQADEALILIRRFAELLNIYGNGDDPNGGGNGNGNGNGDEIETTPTAGDIAKDSQCGTRKPLKSGRPEGKAKQKDIDKPVHYTPSPSGSESDEKSDEKSDDKTQTESLQSGNEGTELLESVVLNQETSEIVCEHLRSN